jgi:hypothetical protein
LGCHPRPLFVPPRVAEDVVVFDGDDERHVPSEDGEEGLIAVAVEGLVRVLVDLWGFVVSKEKGG